MRNNRRSLAFKDDDADPLIVVVNLFDVAMVFAVALMVSMVMNIVKKKGDDMEIIRREGQKVTKYKTVEGAAAPDASQKRGKRLGIMYETDTGETILVND